MGGRGGTNSLDRVMGLDQSEKSAGAVAGSHGYVDALTIQSRYGGGELAGCDGDETVVVAQRRLDAVRALAIDHRTSCIALHVTISSGIGPHVPGVNESPEK